MADDACILNNTLLAGRFMGKEWGHLAPENEKAGAHGWTSAQERICALVACSMSGHVRMGIVAYSSSSKTRQRAIMTGTFNQMFESSLRFEVGIRITRFTSGSASIQI